MHPGAYEGLTDCDRTIGYDRWLNILTVPFLVLKKSPKIELGTLSKVKNTGDSRFVYRPFVSPVEVCLGLAAVSFQILRFCGASPAGSGRSGHRVSGKPYMGEFRDAEV